MFFKTINRFKQHRRNAHKAVEQIQRGEWVPQWNSLARRHLTATKDGKALWIGNGTWFCDIDEKNYFGLFWRHYVWWKAARRLKKEADCNTTPVLED